MNNTKRREKYSQEEVIKIIKDNNKSLKRIESKLDDDPLINIFSKNKDRKKSLIKFLLSLIIMIIGLILACIFLYKDKNILDKIFDVLGNGFYWIIGCYLYIFISSFINKYYGGVNCGKRKK